VRKTGAYSNRTGTLPLDGTTAEAVLRRSGSDSAKRAAATVIVANMCVRTAGLDPSPRTFGRRLTKNALESIHVLDRGEGVC